VDPRPTGASFDSRLNTPHRDKIATSRHKPPITSPLMMLKRPKVALCIVECALPAGAATRAVKDRRVRMNARGPSRVARPWRFITMIQHIHQRDGARLQLAPERESEP